MEPSLPRLPDAILAQLAEQEKGLNFKVPAPPVDPLAFPDANKLVDDIVRDAPKESDFPVPDAKAGQLGADYKPDEWGSAFRDGKPTLVVTTGPKPFSDLGSIGSVWAEESVAQTPAFPSVDQAATKKHLPPLREASLDEIVKRRAKLFEEYGSIDKVWEAESKMWSDESVREVESEEKRPPAAVPPAPPTKRIDPKPDKGEDAWDDMSKWAEE